MEISQKPCISVAILKITRDQVQAHKETSSKKESNTNCTMVCWFLITWSLSAPVLVLFVTAAPKFIIQSELKLNPELLKIAHTRWSAF